MIQAQNGIVTINGSNLQLIEDFNCIIDMLMENHAEIFIASSASWSDIVLNKLPNCDHNHLNIVQAISDVYIKHNVKEKADND